MWDLSSGIMLCVLRHSYAVHAVSFSYDSNQIICGGCDGIVYIWKIETESIRPHDVRPHCWRDFRMRYCWWVEDYERVGRGTKLQGFGKLCDAVARPSITSKKGKKTCIVSRRIPPQTHVHTYTPSISLYLFISVITRSVATCVCCHASRVDYGKWRIFRKYSRIRLRVRNSRKWTICPLVLKQKRINTSRYAGRLVRKHLIQKSARGIYSRIKKSGMSTIADSFSEYPPVVEPIIVTF